MTTRLTFDLIDDSKESSIYANLQSRAQASPDAVAIVSSEVGRALSYKQLGEQIEYTIAKLNQIGIGRGDRVATILGNGPEMAAVFLGVTAATTIAPINPTSSANELEFLLRDLAPKALFVTPDAKESVLVIAANLNVPVIQVQPKPDDAAGSFTLSASSQIAPHCQEGTAGMDDVALLLYTSGTTARPKLVPLTQRNLVASAKNVMATLALTPVDRCLDLMPLFHIHGLVAGLLAPLLAGGSVICPPGFYATDFFGWLSELRPTWYTAVPTMHQAILGRAGSHAGVLRHHNLRFIRSSSASLPQPVLNDLEATFSVPVVEAYGMTEASHQMASNPITLAGRKPGSVGPAAGPEIAIMNDAGELLAPGTTGEVVIRGANVMAGYLANPEANATAFTNGWFRTGDQGYFDSDGYLVLNGRLKELIIRGGEKIAPLEIDEALLSHPAVEQAATFAIPDARLGESVAAVVVLREGQQASESELREFVASRLAPFKVPSLIKNVQEIPKGPTGKVQRLGLARTLGLDTIAPEKPEINSGFATPSPGLEQTLVQLWAAVLELPPASIGANDRFLDIGGDSMLALRLARRIEKDLGVSVPLGRFYLAATIAEQAKLFADLTPGTPWSSLVPIQSGADSPSLFCVHDLFGEVLVYFALAQRLGPTQRVYGLQARGLDGVQKAHETIEEMARSYVEEIRTVQPEGPYHLLGYSGGGSIAYEIAQQFSAANQSVGLLAMLDHTAPGTVFPNRVRSFTYAWRFLSNIVCNIPSWLNRMVRLRRQDLPGYVRWRWKLIQNTVTRAFSGGGWRVSIGLERLAEIDAEQSGEDLSAMPEHRRRIVEAQLEALQRYSPRGYPGAILLFRASKQPLLSAHDPCLGWGGLASGGVTVRSTVGNHNDLFNDVNLRQIAKVLRGHLGIVGQD